MVHELKTWPEDFDAIAEGRKRHEVRSTADRKFSVDDDLRLRRWDPSSKTYTGQELLAHVTYVTAGGTYALLKGVCVMSIEVCRRG